MEVKMLILCVFTYMAALTSASVILKDNHINPAFMLRHSLNDQELPEADILVSKDTKDQEDIPSINEDPVKEDTNNDKGGLHNDHEWIAEDEEMEESIEPEEDAKSDEIENTGKIYFYHPRFQREANPGNYENNNGRVKVNLNRESTEGTRINGSAFRTIWKSRDGKGRQEAGEKYSRRYWGQYEASSPDYGGYINFSRSFRREASPDVEDDKNLIDFKVENGRRDGTAVDSSAARTLWESRDGNGRLEAGAQYNRMYGGQFGNSRPNYGSFINSTHRFRRQINPYDVHVRVGPRTFSGTEIGADVTRTIWQSRNGNSNLKVGAHTNLGFGGQNGFRQPNYGGYLTFTHRFRREASPDVEDDKFE